MVCNESLGLDQYLNEKGLQFSMPNLAGSLFKMLNLKEVLDIWCRFAHKFNPADWLRN